MFFLQNITEFDVAVLYEVLLCCKSVMNSSAGMDGFIAVADSIETIVNCLQFDFKYLSLLILEILSVCCYYSTSSAHSVFQGLKA